VNLAALVVAGLALVVALTSAFYTRRATMSSETSTRLAAEADKRERTPRLTVTPEKGGGAGGQIFYTLQNDGPHDLDSVVVRRPRTADGITYPVRNPGGDWADYGVDLGAIPLTEERRFSLAVQTGQPLPVFRVVVVCVAGDDRWEVIETLDTGRYPWSVG
jgi:hypothetical protein